MRDQPKTTRAESKRPPRWLLTATRTRSVFFLLSCGLIVVLAGVWLIRDPMSLEFDRSQYDLGVTVILWGTLLEAIGLLAFALRLFLDRTGA